MDCSIPVELVGSFDESYPGYIVDYKAPDCFTFRFVGESSPGFPGTIDVTPSSLRKCLRTNYERMDSNPSAGDNVEVLAGKHFSFEHINEIIYQPGDLPPSWWPAQVVKRRGDFVAVNFNELKKSSERFPNLPTPHLENVVEISQVRPVNSQKMLSESDFLYHVLDVPQELVELFKESVNLQHIVHACGQPMLICQITLNMKLPKEFTGLKIVDKSLVKFLIVSTSPETKLKAETLGQDVIKMLRQKYSILHQISELARRIKENKLDKNDELVCEEFAVDKDLVGHSIGAGGSNIRRARSVDGIVSVILNPTTYIFKVTGKTREAVENAKKLLEYATEAMHVPQQYVSRIIGQKNHQIQALVDRVGLAKIQVQAAKEATIPNCVPFSFTGTRSAISDAKTLINFITDNLEEIDQLQSKIASNGEVNRYRWWDHSRLKSGREKISHFHSKDDEQTAESGANSATTLNGSVSGSRYRTGKLIGKPTEHLDSASLRDSRPSTYKYSEELIQLSGDIVSNGGTPSPSPRNSVPQLTLKPVESNRQVEKNSRVVSRRGFGSSRRFKGNRNRALQPASSSLEVDVDAVLVPKES